VPPSAALVRRDAKMTLRNGSPWSRISSIRTKLLVYAAAVLLIPTLIYGTLAYTTARASLEPRLHGQLTDDTALIKIAVQDLLAGQLQNVITWADLDVVQGFTSDDAADQVSGFLESVSSDYGVFLDVLIVDSRGICRASSWAEQVGHAYPELRDGFFAADGSPLPAVSYSKQHDAFYVGLAARIPDHHAPRETIGTLIAMLDRAVLDGIVQPQAGDGRADVELLLVDADRRIIAGPAHAIVSDHLPIWTVRDSDSNAAVDRIERGYVYLAPSGTGEELIVSESAFEAHRVLPALDWSVVAVLPYRVALAPVRKSATGF
jgi:hypothetical protein